LHKQNIFISNQFCWTFCSSKNI